jgi:hypothetical protein
MRDPLSKVIGEQTSWEDRTRKDLLPSDSGVQRARNKGTEIGGLYK